MSHLLIKNSAKMVFTKLDLVSVPVLLCGRLQKVDPLVQYLQRALALGTLLVLLVCGRPPSPEDGLSRAFRGLLEVTLSLVCWELCSPGGERVLVGPETVSCSVCPISGILSALPESCLPKKTSECQTSPISGPVSVFSWFGLGSISKQFIG